MNMGGLIKAVMMIDARLVILATMILMSDCGPAAMRVAGGHRLRS